MRTLNMAEIANTCYAQHVRVDSGQIEFLWR